MKILIAEDDFASRKVMQKLLENYGECDVTVDGMEAIEAFSLALDIGEPYDLICLDVMMPKVDGIKALKIIRDIESSKGIDGSKRTKIIITTALAKVSYISSSFQTEYEDYVGKPIDFKELEEVLERFGFR